MKWMFPALMAIMLSACGPSSLSLGTSANSPVELLPKTPEKGRLFTYYQPRAISKWHNNWTLPLDLTGVSWNDSRTATLISRSHVAMAAHYMRDSHTPVMFHDRSGKPYERYIVSTKVLSGVGDIAIGKLNMPLPNEIHAYRLANAADAAKGTAVLITDQTMTASIHRIGATYGNNIGFEFHPDLDPIYRRNLIVGDSGNPTFLLKNGELMLLETHTTGGPGAGPFYGSPEVQAAIKAAMAELGN
jgi:hypothetical protein